MAKEEEQTELAQVSALLVEDNPGDAVLLRSLIPGAESPAVTLEHVTRLQEAVERVGEADFDVILLDLSLPDSTGVDTIIQMREAAKGTPIIVLTGLDDEQTAMIALQQGAQDYLIKGQVDGDLLVRAARYAIERQRLIRELQEALAQIRTLRGLIPICSMCKKIRDDEGYWGQLEEYIRHHTDADFTHGLCPDCYEEMVAQIPAPEE